MGASPRLQPAKRQPVPAKRLAFHLKEGVKREVYWNYVQRNKTVAVLWKAARSVKKKLLG